MEGWRKTDSEGSVILVAVDVTKEITDNTLEWAIQNIVKSKDTLILLALLKTTFTSGKLRMQNQASSDSNNQSSFNQFVASAIKKLSRRNGSIKEEKNYCSLEGRINKKSNSFELGVDEEEMRRIIEVCLEMMNDLCKENKVKHVRAQVKLLPCAQINSVANKAEEYQASWVIIDRGLRKESEYCTRQLNCNIIMVDIPIPKILRLVNESKKEEGREESISISSLQPKNQSDQNNISPNLSSNMMGSSTNATSSIGFSSERDGATTISTMDASSCSPRLHDFIKIVPEGQKIDKNLLAPEYNNQKKLSEKPSSRRGKLYESDTGMTEESTATNSTKTKRSFRGNSTGTKNINENTRQEPVTKGRWSVDSSAFKMVEKTTVQPRRSFTENKANTTSRFDRVSSIRKAMSLSMKQPPKPPPLCSICKNKAPIFGNTPRKFTYEQIEKATDGFSEDNFLAEGGYGPVYKGVLEDFQVVAVKKHKKVSARGASEFCAEVEVLSCAQHRNLVMLVGYCVEGEEWLLVYEFACNGSLDKHLHAKDEKKAMAWKQRQKVAIGSARGLRYLHEDCRIGCIVHRDLRPNNILLTHDFEPMVGDFGLARWQSDGQTPEETRIVGAFGYLAPEYTQTGQVTEKTDVYAFGLLLIELITGLKITDLVRREKLYSLQWGTLLLQSTRIPELVDPRLNGRYVEREVVHMMHIASLCVSPDPEMRPRMSQVLRMLEGDIPSNSFQHQQDATFLQVPRLSDSHLHSQTKTAAMQISNLNSFSTVCQIPPPISRISESTYDQESRSSFSSKAFEQSNFVRKRYGLKFEDYCKEDIMKNRGIGDHDSLDNS